MADIVDAATRSRMMSGIRSRDTKPEIRVRKILHRHGFRFRLHVKGLPGTPDIVLPRYRAVFFVHGCFWHGHDCKIFKMPKTRTQFWQEKISRNRASDAGVVGKLIETGWRVGIVWECATRSVDMETLGECLAKWLRSEDELFEVRK